MKLRPPVIDYRRLRPGNLLSPEFRHVLLLLYWLAYLLSFILLERLLPAATYNTVWCKLDDLIPFCEWFIFPYMSWHVSLLWMSLYTLAYDIPAFKRFMWYLILTTVLAEIVYVVWPSQQLLRPDLAALGRSNLLTKLCGIIYTVDTNTNVCPSLHCIGGFAILFAALDMPRFRTKGWTVFFVIFALLICASTVFMKQHSIVDFFAAIPVILIGWLAIYLPPMIGHRTA
ncbi:MAG: phosphatidic acid phosphatase [Clostridia bacterium]|nr:phosphatidic acid phosphatase [Clostridia bacterium]